MDTLYDERENKKLLMEGKIDNCMMEMEKLHIDVLGLAEVRWTEHLDIRKRLVRCYVLSTFLYASESWILDRQRIKSMLLRCGFFDACSGYHIWTERPII